MSNTTTVNTGGRRQQFTAIAGEEFTVWWKNLPLQQTVSFIAICVLASNYLKVDTQRQISRPQRK